MSRKQFEKLTKYLNSIDDKLEVIIKLQKAALPKPSLGREEKKILKLCDRKHAIEDIERVTGKTKNSIKLTLTRLRTKGLVKSVKIRKKLVYERT